MIYVRKAYKSVTVDNFIDGEDPETTNQFDLNEFKGFYESFEDLCDNCILPKDKKFWFTITSYDQTRYSEKLLPLNTDITEFIIATEWSVTKTGGKATCNSEQRFFSTTLLSLTR